MLIVSNFRNFPETWRSSTGLEGRSVQAYTWREFLRHGKASDSIYVVNCHPRLTEEIAAASLLPGAPARPLVAVDLVLRTPQGLAERLKWIVRRFLLSRVDLFIHYFRDLEGYSKTFGIGPERSVFVPFKSNLCDRFDLKPDPGGEYVLCFGRSLRDFDTFFAAMELVPYPGAIARPDIAELRRHLARFSRSLDALPPNVRQLEDDGSEDAQIRILGGARIVALPVIRGSMVASGISTCLNAMRLGKCVVGTEGPGMTDVFLNGEVLTVPPEDPSALAAAIRRAWEDMELRNRVAAAGLEYSIRAGGEQALYQRIVDSVSAWAAKRS